MKRVIPFAAALLFALAWNLPARELSMLVFPIASGADLQGDAGMFEELLRVELINGNQVRLIDRQLVERTMAELGIFELSAAADEQQLLEAARALRADLYLRGTMGLAGEVPVVTLDLGVTGRGVSIYTRDYALAEGPKKASRLLSGEISDAVTIAQGVRLSDVRALAEMGQYREAARLLERFALFHEGDSQSALVSGMIDKGLAGEAYREAEEYRALFLFDEALLAVNRALSYEPENGLYLETAAAIQEEAARFEREEIGAIIDAVQQLIDERRFQVAQGLLEILYSRDSDDQRIPQAAEAVRRGLREKDHARKAGLAYFEQDYVEARLQLREAIRLNPADPEYARFMEQIEERERLAEESRLRWSAYRGELLSFDPVELFLDKKRLRARPETALALGEWSWRDRATLAEGSFPLRGAEGGYEWKRLLPWLGSVGFIDPYLSWGFGVRLGTGLEEREGAADPSGFRDLEARRVVLGQLYGSGAAEAVILSFLLRMGVELGGGVLYDRLTVREPALDNESVGNDFYALPHAGLSFSLSWMANDQFRLSLGWKGLAALSFPEAGTEKHRFSFLTFGAAFTP